MATSPENKATEYQRLEASLRDSEARLRAILDNVVDGIITINESGIVQSFNPAAERIFGYTAPEVIGQNVKMLMPEPYHSHHDEYLGNYLRTGKARVIGIGREVVGRRKDGSTFPLDLAVSEARVGEERLFTGIIRDITRRKRAEVLLAKQASMSALRVDVGVVLTKGITSRSMLQGCAEAMVKHLDAAFARIWTLSEDGKVLELQASAGMYTHIDGPHGRVPVGKFKIGLIARERKAHLTNNVVEDPRVGDKEWAKREGMVAFAGYPLIVEDRIVGVMAMFARRPLDENTLDALAPVAPEIALGIERLRAEEEQCKLSHAIEQSPSTVTIADTEGNFQYVNPKFVELTGYTAEEVIGKKTSLLKSGETPPEEYKKLWDTITSGGEWRGEFHNKKKSGELYWERSSISPVKNPEGVITHYIKVAEDVTERKRAEEALRRSEGRMRAVLENVVDGIITIDKRGIIQSFNPAAVRIFGYSPDEVISRNVKMLMPEPYHSHHDKYLGNYLRTGKAKVIGIGREVVGRRKDGSTFPMDLAVSEIRMGEERIFTGIIRDITERKEAEEKIKYMAYHDALTGLSNRKHFRECLDRALEHARRTGRMLAVIFLDLDRFKTINDTLGHDVGDLLLQSTAGRLKSCVRKEDTIARQGGDEFTLLITEVPHVEEVVGITGKIIKSIKQPYMLKGHELFITTSVGIAFYPNDGEEAEALMKNADVAMYRAKEEGRDGYQLYNPAMQANSLDKLQLESSLHRAMERDELMVYYQPQVDLKTGEIVGAEALARWKHNQKGMVPAIEFIPLAENIGLIVPIGEWVLHAACAQNKKWQDAGLPPVRVAVNLSAHMFQKQGLVEVVDKVLKETGLDPNFLELEITETVLMKDIDAGARTLMELKDMGVHVAIDDFGTGYSSLSYLTRLPVDRLKIDQSFVRDLTMHPDDDAVVKATVALAHSLRLKAIAEGVETQAQLDFLRSADCDEIQGNLFHKPVTPDELEGLLKQGKRLEAVG